jgi:hypothetical protein
MLTRLQIIEKKKKGKEENKKLPPHLFLKFPFFKSNCSMAGFSCLKRARQG